MRGRHDGRGQSNLTKRLSPPATPAHQHECPHLTWRLLDLPQQRLLTNKARPRLDWRLLYLRPLMYLFGLHIWLVCLRDF